MIDQEEKRIQQAYADGWKDARDMVNWEMRTLIDENSCLKIKLQMYEQLSENIKNILF